MLKATAYIATAVIAFLVGIFFSDLWSARGRSPAAKTPPYFVEVDTALSLVPPPAIVEQELREIERQYDIAQTQHDTAFFERIEADNFILTLPDGRTLTKAQDIALMKTWDPNIRFSSDDLHVEVYGNVAVLTGRMTETQPGGAQFHWRWLDLFLRRNGQWQILSTTQTGW